MLRHGREGNGPGIFGFHRLEVHEPCPKDGSRQQLHRLGCMTVLFDLIVKRSDDASYGALLVERG